MIPKALVKDLIEKVAQDFPIVHPFWKNFAKDASTGYTVVYRVLRNCMEWYDLRRPAFRQQELGDYSGYKFEDNFNDFLESKITEDQIELIPTAIITDGTNGAWTNAKYWDYREPILYGGCSTTVEYTHRRKLVCYQAEDGWFTDDSAIYFLEEWDYDFVTLFSYCMDNVINEAKKNVNFGGVEFLSFLDQLVSNYDNDKKRSEASDLVLLRMWR